MNLLAINSVEEFDHLNDIFYINRTSFGEHSYIGGTNLMSQTWYWVDDGSKMDLEPKHWHTGAPNGQDESEYCADFIQTDNKFIINDVPCRSTEHIWKFLCEKFESNYEKQDKLSKSNSLASQKQKTCKNSNFLIFVLLTCVAIIILMAVKIYMMTKNKTFFGKYDEMNVIE